VRRDYRVSTKSLSVPSSKIYRSGNQSNFIKSGRAVGTATGPRPALNMGNRHSHYSTASTPRDYRSRRRDGRYRPRVHYGDGSFFQPDKDPYAYYTVTSSRRYDGRTGRLLHETHDPIHISPQIDERGNVTYAIEATNPREDPDRLAFFEDVINAKGRSSIIRPYDDNRTSPHSHRHRYTSHPGIDHSRYTGDPYRSDNSDFSSDNQSHRSRSMRRDRYGSHRSRSVEGRSSRMGSW